MEHGKILNNLSFPLLPSILYVFLPFFSITNTEIDHSLPHLPTCYLNFVPTLSYPALIFPALTLIPDFHPLCSLPSSSGLLPQKHEPVLIFPLPPLKNIHLVISFLLFLCNLTSHLQSQAVALLLQFSPPTGFLPISSTEMFLDQVSNDLFFTRAQIQHSCCIFPN